MSDDSEFDAGDADPWDFFSAASEPEDVDLEGVDDVQHAPAANDDGPSGSTTARSVATRGEDANPTGTLCGPDDSSTASRRGNGPGPGPSGTPSRITPSTPDPVSTGTPWNARVTDATLAGAPASDADAGAAGIRSGLYNEPVSFEGRSLEGTPLSDDSKELAQSLDGAEIPIEDLPPVEPGPAGPRRNSILEHADDMPDPGLSYVDEDEAITDRRIEYARNTRGRSNRNPDTVWRRARNRKEAVDAANARWSEFAAAKRTSSTFFSDDPRQVLYLVEHETTLYSNTGEKKTRRGSRSGREQNVAGHSAHDREPGPMGGGIANGRARTVGRGSSDACGGRAVGLGTSATIWAGSQDGAAVSVGAEVASVSTHGEDRHSAG